MILSRELGKRIWGGSTSIDNGGGGISSDYIAGLLAGYATESWVDEHYISIDFFSRLFQAHGTENGSEIDVLPNDMDTAITSVESMFGFWTNLYISALGSNGAAPAGISLGMLTDVTISGTPSAGQVLTFDAATQKWVNANAQAGATSLANLTDVTLTTPAYGQVLLYDGTKWVNSALKTINGNSIFGTGDIPASGGSSGNYLPLAGGTMTGTIRFNLSGTTTALQFTPLGETIDQTGNFKFGANSGDYNIFKNDGNIIFRIYQYQDTSKPTMLVNNYQTTGDTRSIWALAPNMVANSVNEISVGKSASTGNMGQIMFEYSGDNNDNNRIRIGFYGHGPSLTIKKNYYIGVLNDNPEYALDISGSLHVTNGIVNVPSISFSSNGHYRFDAYGNLHPTTNTDDNSWNVYRYDGNSAITIKAQSGNVGIGSVPSYKLHVEGTIYATGAITALSDARKKDITGETGLTVEQIAHAPAVQFLWKDKERRKDGQQVGTLAQYWQTVLPEVVSDKGGELSMQYGVAALVSSIIIARKVENHEVRIGKMEKWMKKWAEENDE